MKTLLALLLFLVFPGVLCSQTRLISEKDAAAIPYAHIFLDNAFYTYSDESGAFLIDAKEKFDTLTIAHLSYETKRISSASVKNTAIITLAEKENVLEEVSVISKRKKWKKQTLLPGKPVKYSSGQRRDLLLLFETGTTFGEENSNDIEISKAVYVPNESGNAEAYITKIILNSADKEIDGDQNYIPFRVNLMAYDTIRKLPGEKIFTEDFFVGKKKGQTIIIDLSNEGYITFPKEGVCVVVSVYNSRYYQNNGFKTPPAFQAVQINKSSAWREYSFGLTNKNIWEEQYYSQVREQCFNWGIEIEEQK